jgi:hypothetical protein
VKRIGIFLLALATVLPTAQAGSPTPPPPSVEPAKPRSFLDPVGDFVNDSILRPTHPFEFVPGKDPNGWGFSLEPYLWLAGLSGTTGIEPAPPLDVDFRSRTILQNLNWALMAMGEVRKGRWGLIADGLYMELEGSGELGGTLYRSGTLEVYQGLASLALAYRVIDDRRGFLDVYAGARYNYLGMDLALDQDPEGISRVAEDFTGRLQTGISETIAGLLAGKKDAILSEISAQALAALPAGRLRDLAKPSPELRDLIGNRRLEKIFQPNRGPMAEFISAQVEAKAAAAKGQLTAALQNKVNSARAKLSKELASALEENLPTSGSRDVWWIDPLVGLRGQVNFTRWLFLAAQADVGGFGAGSQITWNLIGTVGVNFTRNISAELGYRYMYVDYDRNGFLYDVSTFGVFSSLGVKF